jgi:hypothetical protein
MEAIGGSGFWGTSKAYCSFCGWNLVRAKETEREALKQLPWGFLLLLIFCALTGYSRKSGFTFSFSVFAVFSAFLLTLGIVTWRKLRILETSHPSASYVNPVTSTIRVEQGSRPTGIDRCHYLATLPKPRRVRVKPIPRIIAIAYPLSMVFVIYFGYETARNDIVVSGLRAMFGNLGFFLFFSLVWSGVGLMTIRKTRRDRRLLGEGALAIATITSQELTGGKHRRSYNPSDPLENVVLETAACELVTD